MYTKSRELYRWLHRTNESHHLFPTHCDLCAGDDIRSCTTNNDDLMKKKKIAISANPWRRETQKPNQKQQKEKHENNQISQTNDYRIFES